MNSNALLDALGAVGALVCLTVGMPEPVQAAPELHQIYIMRIRRLRRACWRWLALVGVFGLLSAPVRAADWSQDDSAWQASYLVLHVADWRQTLDIENHAGLYEINPILGRYPSDSEINRYFLATALLHTGAAYLLPPAWRRLFQKLTIGLEAGTVERNYRLGLSVSF